MPTWIKCTEKPLPIVVSGTRMNIKYKGRADLLQYLVGAWYWYDEGKETFPVDKDSFSAIEWLDESDSLPTEPIVDDAEQNKLLQELHDKAVTSPTLAKFVQSAKEKFMIARKP